MQTVTSRADWFAAAARELVQWHAVTSVWCPDGHRSVAGGVSIAPEQWQAVQEATQ
jgi:hypothetical protein